MGLAQFLRIREICRIRFVLPLPPSVLTQNVIPEQDQTLGASRRKASTAELILPTEFSGTAVIIAVATSVHRPSPPPTG
jgi:hypothetical protein